MKRSRYGTFTATKTLPRYEHGEQIYYVTFTAKMEREPDSWDCPGGETIESVTIEECYNVETEIYTNAVIKAGIERRLEHALYRGDIDVDWE